MNRTDADTMCVGKRRYHSRKEAKRVRNSRQKQGASKHLRFYQCPHCHYWHLTSLIAR